MGLCSSRDSLIISKGSVLPAGTSRFTTLAVARKQRTQTMHFLQIPDSAGSQDSAENVQGNTPEREGSEGALMASHRSNGDRVGLVK